MASFSLKSAQFRKERERSWRELDRILDETQRRGLSSLSASDLHRLPILYRGAVSSLSVARAISLDKALLDYLEGLVSRAYLLVYTSKRPPKEFFIDFFVNRFPGAVYSCRWYVAISAALLLLGFLCGFLLTSEDMERYSSFVPDGMASGRTLDATTESLTKALYREEEGTSGLTLFASMLFTNNAKVGILCFCLGFVAGLPTVILLFYNGLILGAMTSLYHSRGLGWAFLAWVMGHGVTELGAVALCGAGGLVLARALLFPGSLLRADSLSQSGPIVAPIIVGSVVMLFFAALLESFFRQLVPSDLARWGVATATAIFWIWYFLIHGRRRGAPSPSHLLALEQRVSLP
jgi:uncharacterized membrane protein SpoIIM required for sporulation